ncbi:MAG: YHS domain-containing protein [Chloroflexota bacterium]|nr:YHS domain-containing protein [Chloroflexota bacterium]
MARVVDPVCGMEFSERDAAAWSVYQNRIYYFCHPVCKKIFDADPTPFVDDANPEVLKPKFTRGDVTPAA